MQNPDFPQVYYVRDHEIVDGKAVPKRNAPPIACVALKRLADGTVARGISIRSGNDNWSYRDGRSRAVKRVFEALKSKKSTLPIGLPVVVKSAERVPQEQLDGTVKMVPREEPRTVGIDFLRVWTSHFDASAPAILFKSAFNPKLTAFELSLLDIADKRKAETAAKVTAAVDHIAQAGTPEVSCQCCHGCACAAHE